MLRRWIILAAMRRIKITLEALPEGVYLATAAELPGFTAEYRGDEALFENIRNLAREFIALDGDARDVDFDIDLKDPA